MNGKLIDITGQQIGGVLVLCLLPGSPRHYKWLCRCACGGEFEARSARLRLGETKSCRACSLARKTKHGHARKGGKRHELYNTWAGMISRCENPNEPGYRYYGARGIAVCKRWRTSFEVFLADMGERPSPEHSIDRVNVDENYEPTNCRWATKTEQIENKRNRLRITFNGTTQLVSQWAAQTGLPYQTLQCRLKRGWSPERALTQAIQHRRAA